MRNLGFVVSQQRKNLKVRDECYARRDKPFLTACGTEDTLMAGRDKEWQDIVPAAKVQPHTLVPRGAHFIQDDEPVVLSQIGIDFVNAK